MGIQEPPSFDVAQKEPFDLMRGNAYGTHLFIHLPVTVHAVWLNNPIWYDQRKGSDTRLLKF